MKAAGVLKVGTETEFAPFDFIDAGQHVGLNVDLFDEVGKELGVKIEWVTLPWDGVLPGLEAGKFDMVAGPATITKARMEHYVFSAPIAEATKIPAAEVRPRTTWRWEEIDWRNKRPAPMKPIPVIAPARALGASFKASTPTIALPVPISAKVRSPAAEPRSCRSKPRR